MPLSAGQRFSAYYFVLFAGVAAVAPYLAVWLDSIDVSARWTGIIVSAPSVLMVLTTLFIARWADSLQDRRSAILVTNVVVLLVMLALWFTTHPIAILVIWTLGGIAMMAQVPIVDAMTLKRLRETDDDFGKVRMFGSLGFVLALLACGSLYEQQGIGLFLLVLTTVNGARLLVSLGLSKSRPSAHPALGSQTDPQFNAQSEPHSNQETCAKSSPESSATAPASERPAAALFASGILLTVGGAAAINASHALLSTFGILHWKQLGYGESIGSLLFGIGVVTEIALMWRFKALTGNFGARKVLLFAAAIGLLRWSILAVEPPLWLTILAQTLHGVTFGMTYIAIANFISRRVPEQQAARGQSMNAVIQMGSMAIATYLCGLYFDQLGATLFFAMAGLCALSVLLLLASYRTSLLE